MKDNDNKLEFKNIIDFALWQEEHYVKEKILHGQKDRLASEEVVSRAKAAKPTHTSDGIASFTDRKLTKAVSVSPVTMTDDGGAKITVPGSIPITFLATVYNEESRIRYVLEHAVRWADEVVILNKSSTDRTKDICLKYGNKVRVIDIPFSPKGHDNTIDDIKLASNDWVFIGTASEMPTQSLIRRVRQVLSETQGNLDLVYVPRKYYSFGVHDKRSPWSISYFPFLINRRKAIVSNTIHHNYKPSNPQNTARIEFSEDCCVYHLTHTTAKGYLCDMAQYFEMEAACCNDPTAKIQECLGNIARYEQQLRQGGNDLLGHYFAWPIYWLGTALFIWEKQRGINVEKYYKELGDEILKREWGISENNKEGCAETLQDRLNLNIKVSAIVSAYNSERFIRGCLEDLTDQTLYKKGVLEIIVIDSCSQQNERAIIEEFQKSHKNIVSVRTEERETIYAAWNRAIKIAKGKYVTNANTDDRHKVDAFEILVNTLEANPGAALAYADQVYTAIPNERFETTTSKTLRVWSAYSYQTLRSHCMVSSQPMWKRSLHDKYGLFDATFASAGDYEFWLRIGQNERFIKVNQVLGLYYINPEGVENASPLSQAENIRIREKYKIRDDELRTSAFATYTPTTVSNKTPNNVCHVSVIIPCYNQAQFLTEAVESVVNQTFTNWECIIVNDGSPDNTSDITRQIIANYPDKHIRLIEKTNGGISDARNVGIKNAKGKYILPLDADDFIHPEMLQKTVSLLKMHPEIAIAYTDVKHFGGANRIVCAGEYDFKRLCLQNHLNYCALFRREIWGSAGGYNPNMAMGYEDWDFWISCGEKGYYGKRISEPLFMYRVKETSRDTKAREHHSELTAQIVINHPSLYDQKYVLEAKKLLDQCSADKLKTNPLVSVIVPTYNRPETLKGALESIAAQSYKGIEAVVVNDAGEDVSGIIDTFQNRLSVKYLVHDENKGLAAARNTAIKHVSGKYIAYLDDDDIYYSDHIETVLNVLTKTDYKVVYTDAFRAYQTKVGSTYQIIKKDIPYSIDYVKSIFYKTNITPVICVVHDRACFDEVGFFDESLCVLEDWDLWIRMATKFDFYHIKKTTCEFRWRVDGTSMTSKKQDEFERVRKLIYEKYKNYSKEMYTQASPTSSKSAPAQIVQKKVSIIILTWNALDYTKKCVHSIQNHTSYPHEIVFVDNASTDGTVEYLRNLIKGHSNYKLIENKENRGFAAGNNQGVAAASGDYVLLLNNDVLVSDGWLESLVESLEKDEKIGMVGPITNSISGRQMINSIPYTDDAGFHEFSRKIRKAYYGRLTPRYRIAGFATLMKKSLYEEVSGLDESFGTGNYEDDDLCLKIRDKGYAVMVDESVFIHHYRSQTFIENKIDYRSSLSVNESKFVKKWPDVDYKSLLELDKSLVDINADLISQGQKAIASEDADEAIKVYLKALSTNPIDEAVLCGIGMVYQMVGKTDCAIDAYKKVIKKYTNFSQQSPSGGNSYLLDAYHNLALVYTGTNQIDDAIFMLKKAIELSGCDATLHNNLGVLYFKKKMCTEAAKCFSDALSIDAHYGDAKKNLEKVLRM